MSGDDYLWDRSGRPDPEVAELEQLLGRFAHEGRPLARPHGRRWLAISSAAALLVAIAGAVWLLSRPGPEAGANGGIALFAGDERLAEDQWFVATESARELELGEVGELRLAAGSRLQVRRVDEQETRLFLEQGHLHAFVAATVRPRFFQVDTPAARCVDLGCMYDLRVDDRGDAHVEVSLGQIAFELGDRDVYVPRGAECFAVKGRGLGTPRFTDCDAAIAQMLTLIDTEDDADRRVDYVHKLASVVEAPRDSLSLWHLLRDPDPRIAERVEQRLVELAGHPAASDEPADAAAWREHLEPLWW